MRTMLPALLSTSFAKKVKAIFTRKNRNNLTISVENLTEICCYSTTINNSNNINDAKQCNASFLFSPIAVSFSDAVSAEKKSYDIALAKSYSLNKRENNLPLTLSNNSL